MNQTGAILIKVSDEERAKVLQSIQHLNAIEHVRQMTLQSLADDSNIRVTKVRHIIDDLMSTDLIKRYNVSDKPVRPRYYYVLSDKAHDFLNQQTTG